VILSRKIEALKAFVGLRESAKHYFLMGYALLRRILVELDTRMELQGGIFYLLPEELASLLHGTDFSRTIRERRRRRTILLAIPVPSVLFSDDLDAIGRTESRQSGPILQGVPL